MIALLAAMAEKPGAPNIGPVAPSAAFYVGLAFVAVVCVTYWLGVRRAFEKCTCQDKPKHLRPKWKKYDGKDKD